MKLRILARALMKAVKTFPAIVLNNSAVVIRIKKRDLNGLPRRQTIPITNLQENRY